MTALTSDSAFDQVLATLLGAHAGECRKIDTREGVIRRSASRNPFRADLRELGLTEREWNRKAGLMGDPYLAVPGFCDAPGDAVGNDGKANDPEQRPAQDPEYFFHPPSPGPNITDRDPGGAARLRDEVKRGLQDQERDDRDEAVDHDHAFFLFVVLGFAAVLVRGSHSPDDVADVVGDEQPALFIDCDADWAAFRLACAIDEARQDVDRHA
jgi:hypothetical protein